MKQPTKKDKTNNRHQTSKKCGKPKKIGTSKLEEKFAKDFLDKLGLKYIYQFKAENIGRYYDFMVYTKNGGNILIEIDGDYW